MEPQGVVAGTRNDGSAAPLIERVAVPRAADVLADQLRLRMFGGTITPGQHLPSERALVEQTGLGRASVREALRMLEAQGLVDRKLGRSGGWIARQPGHTSVSRSIEVLIRGQQMSFEVLLETREAIEPACAGLAARHRTDADLRALELQTERVRTAAAHVPDYLRANLLWHLTVVEASHNDLLIASMTALSDAIHAGTDIKDFNSKTVRAAALRAHDRVVEAIRDADEDAAFARMRAHVHAFRVQASGGSEPGRTAPRKRAIPFELGSAISSKR